MVLTKISCAITLVTIFSQNWEKVMYINMYGCDVAPFYYYLQVSGGVEWSGNGLTCHAMREDASASGV